MKELVAFVINCVGNSNHIKKTISLFNCKYWLHNLDTNEHGSVFIEKIMNFISNSNLNELVIYGDRDPPWMNCYIKNLIVAINSFHKNIVLSLSNTENLFMFKDYKTSQLNQFYTAKQKYFNKISKNICDPLSSTKFYWSLLKTILHEKKVTCIPPSFHTNKYVTGFYSFFANQCSLISNNILTSELKLLW